MLFGNIQAPQALCIMLEKGVELAFFSLSGQLLCQLTPPQPKNIPSDFLLKIQSRCTYRMVVLRLWQKPK
ncbi:hypothetical protein ACFLZM_04375 [Thermodesulfobacteriota bacterium]